LAANAIPEFYANFQESEALINGARLNSMSSSPFEALNNRIIPALNLEVQEYRHRATGARHIHLAASDPQNAFLVAFLTAPRDSTGVAHILEHTALCGSRRFPVRDPFFMMTRRSLNTFMNAFTSSDWTAYPFASQNPKDFDNLLQVYMDAAFFPNLEAMDFAQEGHRLEFVHPEDPAESELAFKGIVFNEMKGAMSSPIQKLGQDLQTRLFPTTTYHYNSGGDPESIPNLTHTQLKSFHARHYHPSNAIFMTYGDIPATVHQDRFETLALSRFEPLRLDLEIPDERRYGAPVAAISHYALDGEDDPRHKTHIVLGWLLDKTTDPRAVMRARVLTSVLLDNSSSPLRHALETTNLGTAPSPLCGFDNGTRESTFTCGLEGSDPEQARAVEDLIMGVIETVAERGAPQALLESALHQLELSQREITGDGFPYGLHLMVEALTPTIHGGDPAAALDIDPLLEDVRREIQDPEFIKGLTRQLLLHNSHRVRLTMAPDPDLNERQTAAEQRRLADLKSRLSSEEKNRIAEQARALQRRQQQRDDPEILPKVGLEDIPAELKIAEGHPRTVAHLPATWFPRGTNGMIYEQIVVDLPALDEELRDLLPLFTVCLTEVGSGERDYLATQALQAAVTGGLSARCVVRGSVDDPLRTRGILVLAGKALARNQSALTDLLAETLTGARFDELPRLRELVAQWRAQQEEAVTDHGHLLAATAASAGLSPAAAISHRWDGLRGLQTLKALDDNLDDLAQLTVLAERFKQLQTLLNGAPRQILVVSEAEREDALAATLDRCWQAHPQSETAQPGFDFPHVNTRIRQGWRINTQVNFCAKAYPTVSQNHPDAPALQVLGNFLRNGYLHGAIREQGGAYGAGAGYHPDSGAFRFFSYRDPRLEETMQDFDRSLDWLMATDHSYPVLEEAILGVIAAIDRPGSPAGEAISAFFGTLFGRTPEHRRAFRQKILAVTIDDLKRVAETYLASDRASSAALSDGATLEKFKDLEVQAV
jgi:Zn-dependent M16 (insulinase) family peptidase